MKKSFKKIFLAGAIASIVTLSIQVPHANAGGIFTSNPTALAEMINKGIADAQQWAEEKATMIVDMKQQVLLQANEIMNDNNIAANTVSRLAQVETDIHNKQLSRDIAPHKSACDTVAFSIEVEQNECEVENNFKQGMADTIGKKIDLKVALKSMAAADGAVEFAYSTAKDILKNELIAQVDFCSKPLQENHYEAAENQIETNGDPKIDSNGSLVYESVDVGESIKSPCTMLHFMAGGAGTHLTPAMDKAAIETIKVLVTTPTSNDDVPNASSFTPENDIIDYRRFAYESLVLNSLNRLRVMHAATDSVVGTGGNEKISFMGALEETINKKFGSIDGALGIIKSANLNGENSTTPATSAKSIDEISRFNLYLNYLKYQQQIRMEALMAATLALELQRSNL